MILTVMVYRTVELRQLGHIRRSSDETIVGALKSAPARFFSVVTCDYLVFSQTVISENVAEHSTDPEVSEVIVSQ